MFDAAVDKNKTVTLGTEWEILKIPAAAVKAHQFALLSENARKLVHYTTVDTAVVMLCCLSHQGKIPFGYLVVTEEVVKRECETALKGCR